jgi:predicted Zn-dependent protease
MKNLAILFFLIIFALTTFGQTPKPTPKKTPKTVKTVAAKFGTETEEFEKAKAISDPAERITAFQTFVKNFPESKEIRRAQGLIVGARAEMADKKLQAGDAAAGIELFKLAVQEAPTPVPDELFTRVILGFPISLDSRSQRAAAFDMAKLIEEKVGPNASQILDLAKFYINVRYGTEAIRLAKRSTELAPDSAVGFLTLAIANRLNFQIEDAAQAYARAVELDGESVTNKHSLAEMKRALGKTDEAIALYRQMLEKDPTDAVARTGLILTLFSGEKIKEAEAELAGSLAANPNNPSLLIGAAYWYAAQKDGAKAVEYSQKALDLDRTQVWAYIAQARGLIAQNKPLEAEKLLLAARQYSDFPTLDYELASARLAAGLYREAAEILKRNFAVNKDGLVETYIGNRILADAGSFTELLSLERRMALFEIKAADTEENTNKLKALLEFSQKLEAKEATEEEISRTAENFATGGDNMRLHRQLFAASRLLQKKTALPKVLDLMQAAIGGVDAALSVASPSAAVMADEIYADRQFAIGQNLVVVVPEIPRQTLSAILRGRIEDIAGQTYFQQNNVGQSIVRLKRALSVLPDKSAWSRASHWHLGEALQADGKEKEALESFIRSYNKEIPDEKKRAFIENLYVKINGNADGLDARIGPKTETTVATSETKPTPDNTDNVKTTEPTPTPETKPEASPTPEVKAAPTPKTEETPETKPETKTATPGLPENLPTVMPEKMPEVSPAPTPTPEATPKIEETKTEETKTEEVKPEPSPSATPVTETQPTPTPETTPTPEAKPKENKSTETNPEPSPQTSPTPQNVSVIITNNLSRILPSPKINAPKTDPKPAENKPAETPAPTAQKPLFDPVVISVGNPENAKTDTPKPETIVPKPVEEKPAEEKPREVKTTEVVQKIEPAPTPEIKPAEKPIDDKILSGEYRPRIIITENTGAKTVTEEISTCKLAISPDSLSLLNGGGSLGVTVGFDGDGDFRQITAASSSPEDIEVRPDIEIGASQKRAFFIIKSVTTKTGVFTVTFEAPCGKKEILVKVR